MGMDNKDELDDELVKSLEKLVEEETSVAKAFVDNQKDTSLKDNESGYSHNSEPEDIGKTKIIPKVTPDMITKTTEDIDKTKSYNTDSVKVNTNKTESESLNNAGKGTSSFVDDNLDNNGKTTMLDTDVVKARTIEKNKMTSTDKSNNISAGSVQHNNNRKTDNESDKAGIPVNSDNDELRKKKLIITVACVVAALVAVIGIITGIVIHNKNKESYKYNYEKAMESYKDEDYDTAIKFFTKAAKLTEGKKNSELKYTLYECYKEKNNTEMQIEMLKDILSFDENNQKAIEALASVYKEKKDGTALSELIKSYKNKNGYKYLSDYIVETPKPSVESGTYDDEQKLQFTETSDSSIYYTLDKSEPTNKSIPYSGGAIEIKNGTTTIKAVAVNSIGVYSDVVELQYIVDYKKPSAPTVSPESGTYSEGQKVTVSNIPSNSKAYYTLDGSTPTANSEEYTEPFDIPAGNNVISVIIIDSHNQSSSVVKRNYVVEKAKTFSYNECLDILKQRLISDGVLKSDGNTTSDGKTVTFVYQPKTTINSVEMYVVRLDVTDKSQTTTSGYYGIGIKSGTCYKVTHNNGSYSAGEY